MNSENVMFNQENTNNFDFSKNWDDEFISVDDDDIIIGAPKDEDSEFSFEEDNSKPYNIFNDFDDVKSGDLSDTKIDFEEVPLDSKEDISFESSTELDSFFDSIYNGVEDANDLITQINKKKQTLAETEKEIASLKEQIDREKAEFAKYMSTQKDALDAEKRQLKEKIHLQRIRLSEESAQVKNEVEVKNNEIDLREQKLKVEVEKFEMQKANFSKYKEVEEEKIKNGLDRLNIEKEQVAKEKELALQTIENSRKEFDIEKEHFERIKQIEEAKLKAERDNLNKNCERFKRLISGLSNNFSSMPNE